MFMNQSPHASSSTSPIGRGRIASTDAIRVRGYCLTIGRTPSPQPSPIEVGFIRLRQIGMTNSGKPELVGRGGRPPLLRAIRVRGYALTIDRTPHPNPLPMGEGAHVRCRNDLDSLSKTRLNPGQART